MGIPESTALSRLYTAREEIQRFIRARQGSNQRKAYAESTLAGSSTGNVRGSR
jgi:hypothetical protein